MGNFEGNRFSGRSRDGGRKSGGNRDGGFGGGSRDRDGGNRGGGFNRNSRQREMFDVTCDKCKSQCQVPFKPSNNKPVLCSNCFSKDKESGNSGSRNNNSVTQGGVSQEQFNQLNTKLDKIIKILQELEIDEGYEAEEDGEEEDEEEVEDEGDEVGEDKDEEEPSKEGKAE